MNIGEMITQLGLDSFGGFFSFVLTVASFALPVLKKYNKRQKKALAGKGVIVSDFVVVEDDSLWQEADAKVLNFSFATGKVAVRKKKLREVKALGPSPLIMVVEFMDRSGNILKGEVFVADEVYNDGELVQIKYNLVDKKQILLQSY